MEERVRERGGRCGRESERGGGERRCGRERVRWSGCTSTVCVYR